MIALKKKRLDGVRITGPDGIHVAAPYVMPKRIVMLMKRKRFFPAALALLCGILLLLPVFHGAASAQGSGLSLHLFSFGKADAFLLLTEEGAVLIDTGESGQGKEILSFLEERGISELDTLIVTHFDKDHVGGAAKVLKGIPVRRVLQSNCPRDSKEYNKYVSALALCRIEPVTVREELSFFLGGASFTVYPPEKETYPKDPSNNSSLAVAVRYGDTSFLFTGDAESARLKELSGTDQKVDPEVAVVTSSEEEPEDYVTVQLLEKAGTEVLLTREGEIDIFSDGNALEIFQNGKNLPTSIAPAA